MSIKIFNTNDSQLWREYLNYLPEENRDIYYTPEYYKIYQEYGDGHACCFVYEDQGDIALYPFFINSINNLGYQLNDNYYDIQGAYGYNGVITSSYNSDFINRFYKEFNNYCRDNNIIAEFTRFHPILKNKLFSESHLDVIYDRHTVVVNLDNGIDKIWAEDYSGTNRNMIRKAEKNKIVICKTDKKSDYLLFADLYNETMNQIKADPYYFFNEKYFINIQDYFNYNSLLLLAYYEGNVVAGSLFFFYNKIAHYHLSARNINYNNFPATNYLLNYAILESIKSGMKYLHLGGGTTNGENDPLFKFKCNFSKSRLDFYIGKKIYNNEIYSEVVEQWKQRNPENVGHTNKLLLKYRYL
jgi:hypothetical protein